MMNPIADWMDFGSQKLLRLMLSGATAVLRVVVFRPMLWSPAAVVLLRWSRDLALATLGAAVVAGSLMAVWAPMIRRQTVEPWSAILLRGVVAAMLMTVVPTGLQLLLTWNNDVVTLLLASPWSTSLWGPGLLAASPLLLIGLALVLIVLIGYLSVVYVVRWIHIAWLAALTPWMALGWVATGRDEKLSRALRELTALSFAQAAQAAAWWLTGRYIGEATDLGTMLVAAGGLWFMARVPNEFRRLLGVGDATPVRILPW